MLKYGNEALSPILLILVNFITHNKQIPKTKAELQLTFSENACCPCAMVQYEQIKAGKDCGN